MPAARFAQFGTASSKIASISPASTRPSRVGCPGRAWS